MILKKRPMFLINSNSRGFTLLELMVVIAIIGVLATIAMRSFMTTRAKVMDAAAFSDARSLGTAITNAFIDGVDVDFAHVATDGSKIGTQDTSGGPRKAVFSLSKGIQAQITGDSNYDDSGFGMCSAEVWWPGSPKKFFLEIDEEHGVFSFPTS